MLFGPRWSHSVYKDAGHGVFCKGNGIWKATPSSPQVRDADAQGQKSQSVKEMKVTVKTPSRRVAKQEEQIKIPVSK